MNSSILQLNVAHCDAAGVHKQRLHHQSIQVCHVVGGNTVLTFSETGRESVLFELSPEQRAHFVSLLQQSTVTPAQTATENVAIGVVSV